MSSPAINLCFQCGRVFENRIYPADPERPVVWFTEDTICCPSCFSLQFGQITDEEYIEIVLDKPNNLRQIFKEKNKTWRKQ